MALLFASRRLLSKSPLLRWPAVVPAGTHHLHRPFASSAPNPREGMEEDDPYYPAEGKGLYRRVGGPGYPMMFVINYDKPSWQPLWEDEQEVMPRDAFGIPALIPPELSTKIKHVYHVPPQFYPFLKKLGDDTAALKPYTDMLMHGKMTFDDYEEMFYKFVKPLKIYRKLIPMPYRTPAEMAKSEEVQWEGNWLAFRQKVAQDYFTQMKIREYITGLLIGGFAGWVWVDCHRQYRIDMKLFYLEAPEHKLNWVVPRGDLV
eukprot:GHVS01046653.1.p1 GENE.GHVS01046653.1~~GHVS01046653.1.p1  ORF type:complete len:268 (+),score=40.13 GHVS01046653.1:27-806(+)